MSTLSREEVLALADLPHGQAIKAIRKVDPLWGIEPGKKIKWEVVLTTDQTMTAYETVEAASLEEAEDLAQGLDPKTLDWEPEYSISSFDVESVEPQP